MANVLDTLRERGFLQQITFEEDLYKLLDREKVTFYVGFDPTADSLHIGHYIPLMAMAHMQQAGHRPIALVGGGTAMVGDPSGRTDMRTMLTPAQLEYNKACIKEQIGRFLDFSEGKAIMVDNADWLLELRYVPFLREIGVHFSVNRMLTAECYKNRMEKGLSFLEFNYMLMQGYDFLELWRRYGCILQMGGDDQWSNILAGADLIRRKEQKPAYACTFSLLLDSQGRKMGKTMGGALFLDAEKVSPYDFYQYWRNVDDADVRRCLSLLTFLPMTEIEALTAHADQRINRAKEVLAWEITRLIHGREEADKAQAAARALFAGGSNIDAVPTAALSGEKLTAGIRVTELLVAGGLTKSLGEGRRLISQGAVSLNEEKVTDPEMVATAAHVGENGILLRKGKKGYFRFIPEE
ncbi:MAG: tyrosine--tRNA ligase [Christensenellales bacterium]